MPAFVRGVVDGLGTADVCLPEIDGFRHPLAAAYRTSVLPVARELIEVGRLRLAGLADRVVTRVLNEADLRPADPELQSLRNVNTPEEYAAALAKHSGRSA